MITIVAGEVLGIEPSAISVRIGDTALPPSGGSGGSTTAASVAPAVFDACQNALAALASISGVSDPSGSNWRSAVSRLRVNPVVARGRWREGLSSRGAGGVQMAEVQVDSETGFICDVPDIDVILQDMPERGVIGIGEPVTIPTAAAIANAVSNAIGKRVTHLPITPSQVLGLLGKLPKVHSAYRGGSTYA